MADSCQHWSRETGYAQASLYAACPWCEIEKLRNDLTAARLELQNIQRERLIWAMACECYCPACTALDKLIRGTEHPGENP